MEGLDGERGGFVTGTAAGGDNTAKGFDKEIGGAGVSDGVFGVGGRAEATGVLLLLMAAEEEEGRAAEEAEAVLVCWERVVVGARVGRSLLRQ
jgi:hypothetical protein